MASNNPHGLQDGMLVRKVAAPSKLFRVSGDPDVGRATYVAMSKGERTVLNGNARNYRPETPDERAERENTDLETSATVAANSTPVDDARFVLRSVPSIARDEDNDDEDRDDEDRDDEDRDDEDRDDEHGDFDDIAELCAKVTDAVAPIAGGACSPAEAANLVLAVAELNAAVTRRFDNS